MRNLKKILALVLALVMSLSLMAVAGAKDFTDKADINADYQAAVDVLNGLEVFRGYENGSFQPKGDITRAEVATIIYRIATADVKDAQAGIYTTWGKFADVKDTDWYAGYVNYCANAGIVHGKTPAGVTPAIFDPNARITGYQVLAMILRTIGYGKNGEFEGANWAINTAAQAKALGIIDGVTENLLGANATREFVAQMLFKTMLTSEVDYSVLEGYKPNGKTLAKEKFGMERIDGIVVANEYADLRDDDTMGDGQTVLRTADGDVIMNVTTDLNDIGESRYAYVVSDGKRSNNLVTGVLYDTGRNVTTETGDAANVANFAGKAGLSVSGAEHFINFDYATVGESEFRIEYQVKFNNDKLYNGMTSQEWFADEYGVDPAAVLDDDNRLDDVKQVGNTFTYTRVIPMGNEISSADIAIMKGIFSAADDDIHTDVGVSGYVYAGTAKNNAKEQRDLSSEMSWRAFEAEYLNSRVDTTVKSTVNGDWLKVIDNNNDGAAEYVFKTEYVLDEVTGYNSRYDYFRFVNENNDGIDLNPDSYGWDVNYGDYEPAIGDVVLGALIDGKWQIEKAPMETKTIQTVNFKDKLVVTTDGDTWYQSGITNATEYADQMLDMNQKTEYEIFFDKFDHIRAYRTTKGADDYALLSELYFSNQYNSAIIKNSTAIVEITIQDAKTVEMPVSNASSSNPSVFEGVRVNTDYLQRAINHLAVSNSINHPTKPGWNDKDVSTSSTPFNGDEFKWNGKVSETNVAVYNLTDDGDTVALDTVSAFKYDRQNKQLFYSDLAEDGTVLALNKQNEVKVNEDEYYNRYYKWAGVTGTPTAAQRAAADAAFKALTPVYAIDYVQLDGANGLSKGAVRYNIHEDDCSYNLYDTLNGDTKYDGNYVNATHNTQYYLVSIGSNGRATGVSYFTDYSNVPAIKAGKITAMYAVASNTTSDTDSRDYWVAEVIVIETTGVQQNYDSVALAYYNPEKTSGNVRTLEALDNMTDDPAVVLTPKKLTDWYYGSNAQWTGYGFYELYDTEVDEPDVASGKIVKVDEDSETGYNDHGIHAAIVTRDTRVLGEGGYIMIDRTGHNYDKNDEIRLAVNDKVKVYGIYTRNAKDKYPIYELDDSMTVNDLQAGDQIIYVRDKWNDALRYIVVVNYVDKNTLNHVSINEVNRGWANHPDLEDDYLDILAEQNYKAPETRTPVELTFNLTGDETATVTCGDQEKTADSKNLTVTILVDDPTHFTFNLKAANLAALVPTGTYTFHKTPVADKTNEWTVTAIDTTAQQTNSADVKAPIPAGKAYTVNAVKAIIAQVANMNIGGDGEGTAAVELAKNLVTELMGIAVNLVSNVAVDNAGTTLDTAIVNTVVDVKVEVYFIEHPDVDKEANVDAVKAAVEGAVKEAVENAEPVSGEAIDAAVEEKVDEAVAEVIKPTTVDVTLKTENGIGVASAADKNGAVTVTDSGDNVYTLTADTELTVVLTITSEEELDETNPVIVIVDGKAVDADVALDADAKTVTVVLDLPTDATKVTYEFVLNTKEEANP